MSPLSVASDAVPLTTGIGSRGFAVDRPQLPVWEVRNGVEQGPGHPRGCRRAALVSCLPESRLANRISATCRPRIGSGSMSTLGRRSKAIDVVDDPGSEGDQSA